MFKIGLIFSPKKGVHTKRKGKGYKGKIAKVLLEMKQERKFPLNLLLKIAKSANLRFITK